MVCPFRNLDRELSNFGLKIRSVKVFNEPNVIDGLKAKSVAIIGHLGSDHWEYFVNWWSKGNNNDLDHPLDDWSKGILKPLAKTYNGVAVFPSDEPYYPFQNWALESDNLSKSQINLLISEEYGTWHGYRGAIALDFVLETPSSTASVPDLCATCQDKPCLSACPVDAFSSENFLYSECQNYLKTELGNQTCMSHGCAARNACPYGERYSYKSPHMRFHMRAFCK